MPSVKCRAKSKPQRFASRSLCASSKPRNFPNGPRTLLAPPPVKRSSSPNMAALASSSASIRTSICLNPWRIASKNFFGPFVNMTSKAPESTLVALSITLFR